MSAQDQTPDWIVDEDGDKIDEWQTLVRAVVISDRTGEGPGGLFTQVGGTAIDRYFEASGVRLPPGSLGQVQGRAVFLYDGGSLVKQKVGIAKARVRIETNR